MLSTLLPVVTAGENIRDVNLYIHKNNIMDTLPPTTQEYQSAACPTGTVKLGWVVDVWYSDPLIDDIVLCGGNCSIEIWAVTSIVEVTCNFRVYLGRNNQKLEGHSIDTDEKVMLPNQPVKFVGWNNLPELPLSKGETLDVAIYYFGNCPTSSESTGTRILYDSIDYPTHVALTVKEGVRFKTDIADEKNVTKIKCGIIDAFGIKDIKAINASISSNGTVTMLGTPNISYEGNTTIAEWALALNLGEYSFSISVGDQSGNEWSQNKTFTVPVPPDKSKPTSPTDGQHTKKMPDFTLCSVIVAVFFIAALWRRR